MQEIIAKTVVLHIALAAFCVGCESSARSRDNEGTTRIQRDQMTQLDRWAVESPGRSSVEAAVIRQATLFEYHFNTGLSTLTPIGRRDALILARHFRGEDWVLSVRQGAADDLLYRDRVLQVESLVEGVSGGAGVVTIVDGLPGGGGLASDEARRIRRDSMEGAGSLQSGAGRAAAGVGALDTPLEEDS